MNLKKQYSNNGYIKINNFLEKKDITKINNEFKKIIKVQLEKFNKKSKNKKLKELIHLAMKNNPQIRKVTYDLIKYASSVRRIQSSETLLKILKNIGFKMPLSTDFPSVRVDISDEKKFLRGPHQDVGSVISKNCATIWIPLTEVNDRRGTVALYKNTHKQKLRKQIFISRENLINNEVSLQGVNLKSKIVINAKPGDLIIFDSFIVHESVPATEKNNIKLNIQFFVNDAQYIDPRNKYFHLKKKFNEIRSKQIEKIS